MRSYRLAALAFAAAAAVAVWLAPDVRADRGFTHVVREGETLASIAQAYYGDPRRETVIVAENGLTAQGGAPIVVGLRLVVPTVSYHRVAEGETWVQLAERFYGDPRRAFMLMEANGGSAGEQPAVGAELLVPYPVRHVAGQSDNVKRVAKLYYDSSSPEAARRLRRFNNLRGNRLTRGQIVLVPLHDLVLSDEGRRMFEEQTGQAPATGETRDLQERIDGQLPALREHVRRGRYTEAVALGHQLLGAESLTGNQIVTIQRELGTAFVALDREDLSVEAFRAALARQPDLELDTLRTSPRVLRVFEHAKELGPLGEDDPEDGPPPAAGGDAGARAAAADAGGG